MSNSSIMFSKDYLHNTQYHVRGIGYKKYLGLKMQMKIKISSAFLFCDFRDCIECK